jgi:mannose-1-phosphate guanylyltransferase
MASRPAAAGLAVAILLAGGKGERLRPLTNDRPKREGSSRDRIATVLAPSRVWGARGYIRRG